MAGQGLPCHSGSDGGPLLVGPLDCRRWLLLHRHRPGAGWQCPAGGTRPGHQRLQHSNLHRLRSLCGQLQECVRQPVCGGQIGAPGAVTSGAAGTGLTRQGDAGSNGGRRLRQLQQQSGMRSGLPAGDLSGLDQLDASGEVQISRAVSAKKSTTNQHQKNLFEIQS